MPSQLQKGLKQLTIKDLLSPVVLLLTIVPAMIFKIINHIRRAPLWLITERKDTASDNAFCFYKYLKENHPEVNSWYVIDKKCNEYENVKQYGNIIQFDSLRHWIYYIASDRKISSQKASNPAPALFYILHVYLNLFNNRIYLKHGIIKDDANWWHYDHTKYQKIICGAASEYKFIKQHFGYPKGAVAYTGLARFDNLHNNNVNPKQILVMPTWRNWLGSNKNIFAGKLNFTETEYFKAWNGILNDKKLATLLERYDLTLIFYPHHNMQKFIKDFIILNERVKVTDRVDIQKLLKESALMITDFSSVFMDFAYMQKPIIFYQFDKIEYRKRQYQQGYFNYEKKGFGEVITDRRKVIDKIEQYAKKGFQPEEIYAERMKKFFPLHDNRNCERIYEAIK